MSLEDILNKKLKAWSKTSEGKASISNFSSSVNSDGTYEYARKTSNEFIRNLNHSISLNTSPILIDILQKSVSVSIPYFIKGQGWTFDVNFDHQALYRDSLWKQGYPKGIDLAYLINNGYHAEKYVYGNVNSKYSRSLLHRDPTGFIQNTIQDFKTKYNKVTIQYNANYTGGTL